MFSFYPAKVAGGLGDGGALITNNDSLANYARSVEIMAEGKNLRRLIGVGIVDLDSINARVIIERIKNLISFN